MNMKIFKHFIIIVICYFIDSLISYILPHSYASAFITIVPYLGLLSFVRSVDYFEGADLYFFAAICGTYYSIIYANSLPIYILIYELIAFARVQFYKYKELSVLEFMALSEVVVILNSVVLYLVMLISQKTSLPIYLMVIYRILPTMLLTILLSYVTYNMFHIFEEYHIVDKRQDMFD